MAFKQGDSGRYEEYATLREETAEYRKHCRDILYFTLVFIVASFSWYLSSRARRNLLPELFSFFMLVVLGLSALLYMVYMRQAYRIGSFIAVFWESREPERGLIWHRFNRKGPPGGFVSESATFVYLISAILVCVFLCIDTRLWEIDLGEIRPFRSIISVEMAGCFEIVFFLRLGKYLRKKRNEFERQWREIKESPYLQETIHTQYERRRRRIRIFR